MAAAGVPTDASNLNNLRDILQTYNKLTDLCFKTCVTSMNNRQLNEREASCVNRCSGKYIAGNQRIMSTFMDIQSRKQQQMFEEAAKLEAEQSSAGDQAGLSSGDKAALSFDLMKAQSEEQASSTTMTQQEQNPHSDQPASGVS